MSLSKEIPRMTTPKLILRSSRSLTSSAISVIIELLAKMEKRMREEEAAKAEKKKHSNRQNHMGRITLLQNTKYHNYRYVIRLFLTVLVISAVLRQI